MNNSEIRDLSSEELSEAISEAEVRAQKLKFAHAVSPIENPAQIKSARKHIARLKTELTVRLVAEVKEKAQGKELESNAQLLEFMNSNSFIAPVGKVQLKRILSKQ